MGMTRRDALKGLGVAAGAIALGCGDNETGLGPDDPDAATGTPDAGDPNAPDAAPTGPDAGPADARPPDLTPAQLLAGIDTIVVLCMENRSFDHFLGSLRLVEGRTDVDGLTGIEVNLDPDGNPVEVFKLEDFTPADPPHSWDEVHRQWNEGRNDGFVTEHAGANQNDVMGYHTRDQLPVTYALADYGVVCNRWFCSVLGPTWPNRMYLHGGTSNGRRDNIPRFQEFETVWDRLADAGKTGANYHYPVQAWLLGVRPDVVAANGKQIERFFSDAAAGTLPNYVVIDPQFFGPGANDDHPANDIRLGQALIGSVVAALAASPQWNKCLFVLTYDEHGGFYDHVPPPVAVDDQSAFQRMGFRVPSVVIGPTVRRRAAVDTVFDHTSVISTLTVRHQLPGLTARSQNASPLSPCIDPAFVNDPQPPPTLPTVVIPRAELEQRLARGGVRPDHHPELQAAIGTLPSVAKLNEATRTVLAWGEKLGVVKLV
jgi:phospholipase C